MLVIFALARTGAAAAAPPRSGAYIGAAYFFTSSTSFANPAITVGRMFSNTFAGIAPSSAPAFIAAQVVGGLAALPSSRSSSRRHPGAGRRGSVTRTSTPPARPSNRGNPTSTTHPKPTREELT